MIFIYGGFRRLGGQKAKGLEYAFLWTLDSNSEMSSLKKDLATQNPTLFKTIQPLKILDMLEYGHQLLVLSENKQSKTSKYFITIHVIDFDTKPLNVTIEPVPNQKNIIRQFDKPIDFASSFILPYGFLTQCNGMFSFMIYKNHFYLVFFWNTDSRIF